MLNATCGVTFFLGIASPLLMFNIVRNITIFSKHCNTWWCRCFQLHLTKWSSTILSFYLAFLLSWSYRILLLWSIDYPSLKIMHNKMNSNINLKHTGKIF
jgi:hypothetical protein